MGRTSDRNSTRADGQLRRHASVAESELFSQINHLFSSVFVQAVKALQQMRRLVILAIEIGHWQVQDSSDLLHDAFTRLVNALFVLRQACNSVAYVRACTFLLSSPDHSIP